MLRAICIAVGLLALTACGGGGDAPRPAAKTPAAPPRATPDPQPTARDAERLRPVIAAWADAVRRGDVDRAARSFALPAIVSQGRAYRLRSAEQVRAFNASLPCGARLVYVQQNGRYVVGTFRLVDRAGSKCDAPGALARVAFVFRGRRFSEWRQVPDARGAPPGPDRPERDVPEAPAPEPPAGAQQA